MVHLRVAHYGFGHNNGRVDDVDRAATEGEKGGGEQCGNGGVVNTCGGKEREKVQGGGRAQDNKQWECDICSKMFTTKYFLKKHKRLHTGKSFIYLLTEAEHYRMLISTIWHLLKKNRLLARSFTE